MLVSTDVQTGKEQMTIQSRLDRRRATRFGHRWLLVVTLAALIAGCAGGPFGLRGSGEMTSETRDVGVFTEVVLEGSGTVSIEVTGTESLTIEAEDNLMSRLTSDVEGGRLVLGSRGVINATREIIYTVTVASLDGVTITGSGEIETRDITTSRFSAEITGSGSMLLTGLELESLDASIEGSGHIEAAGLVDDLEVRIPGSGTFRGEDLETARAIVSIEGSGSAVVDVSETLEASVTGSGRIEYLGSPDVVSSVTGSGSVRPR